MQSNMDMNVDIDIDVDINANRHALALQWWVASQWWWRARKAREESMQPVRGICKGRTSKGRATGGERAGQRGRKNDDKKTAVRTAVDAKNERPTIGQYEHQYAKLERKKVSRAPKRARSTSTINWDRREGSVYVCVVGLSAAASD